VFAPGTNEDALMSAALDAGADDVITQEDGSIEVLSSPADFEAVKAALERAGFVAGIAEVTMRPENTVSLQGEDAERMQKLIDVIEDLDDVQAVHHNAEIEE
jgi:transcriptional/translational regulatory protein YebC/TACO1